MTDTTTGAPVRLQAADEEPDELTSLTDTVGQDSAEEDLYSVFDIEAEEEEPFNSLDEMLAVEKAERDGRQVYWDLLPDFWVHIAHLQAALELRGKLERKLRGEKGWTYVKYPEGQLPGMAEEHLWWEAMPGTCVKDWGGESAKNLPFSKSNFLRLMRDSIRFRKFIFANTKSVDDLRRKMREDAEGN